MEEIAEVSRQIMKRIGHRNSGLLHGRQVTPQPALTFVMSSPVAGNKLVLLSNWRKIVDGLTAQAAGLES
jgi:hypothetical protein